MSRPRKPFWSLVQRSPGCWTWTGVVAARGYAIYYRQYAHRIAWSSVNGPIPDGMQVDHLCRNRACVNPAHLEPVTPATNTLRGMSPWAINARRTECKNGHPFDEANTWVSAKTGKRMCRTCRRLRMREIYKAQAAARQAA